MRSLRALYNQFRSDERGSVLPLVGLCLTVILGFAAIAIDLGGLMAHEPQEFELWLSKTGGPSDPQERKQRAAEIYAIWREAIESAIKSAP
jgi:hypothetical protein